MALTAKERQQAKRDRDKLSTEEREARLLSRSIVTKLYHSDDYALIRSMSRTGITEEQDIISRFIRGADRMTDEQLEAFIHIA